MQAKQLSLFDNEDWFKQYNKPENMTSLAAKYQVTLVTFKKWLQPISDKIPLARKKTFTPSELKVILEFLGEYGG